MSDLQMVAAWVRAAVHQRHAQGGSGSQTGGCEAGATVIEYVIMAAILAAGAIAIATLIVTKFTGKAESIPTG